MTQRNEENGYEIVGRAMALRGMSNERREASFIASTDAIDSYGEIVEQSWILDRYRTNPIVLYAHNSRELPIGSCSTVEVVNGRLECTIVFASAKANPRAEEVWTLYREGVLKGVSVGFVPRSVRKESRDGQEVWVLSDNELLEISVVPIPANPEALAKMKQRAMLARQHKASPSRELVDFAVAIERSTGLPRADLVEEADSYELLAAVEREVAAGDGDEEPTEPTTIGELIEIELREGATP